MILFSDNVAGVLSGTRALTDELQRAAREGGNPPLLIMTDQEGGDVKRLPGPPILAPSDMTSSTLAFDQGRAAGRLLRAAGINVDLAPVADVEHVTGSFLASRSFGSTTTKVAHLACAFADGLASERVGYTLKHFPGLGRALSSTDLRPVLIKATEGQLRNDYGAYRSCGANPDALVMVSSATYPSVTGSLPAVMSAATYRSELRTAVPGRAPVTLSDDLQSPAISSQVVPARRAINAGLDLLLYAQTELASSEAYSKLLTDARDGALGVARIRAASAAVVALKRRVTLS